jgi:hypothetical protein
VYSDHILYVSDHALCVSVHALCVMSVEQLKRDQLWVTDNSNTRRF